MLCNGVWRKPVFYEHFKAERFYYEWHPSQGWIPITHNILPELPLVKSSSVRNNPVLLKLWFQSANLTNTMHTFKSALVLLVLFFRSFQCQQQMNKVGEKSENQDAFFTVWNIAMDTQQFSHLREKIGVRWLRTMCFGKYMCAQVAEDTERGIRMIILISFIFGWNF